MKRITKSLTAILLALTVVLFSAITAFAATSCTKCGRIFESDSAYNIHTRACEAEKTTEAITYICGYCTAIYETKALFSAHVESCVAKPKIPQKGNVNTCPHCLKDFEVENEYNNHIQLCRTTYQCSKCSKEFGENYILIAHKLICPIVSPEVQTEVVIANNPGSTEIKYGDILVLTAETKNMPAGASVKWDISGDAAAIEPSQDGKTCRVVASGDGSVTVMARVVDKDGKPVKTVTGKEIYDSQVVVCDGGFFQKIISFFKNLFRVDRTVTQAI